MTDVQSTLSAELETPIRIEVARDTACIAQLSPNERVCMNRFRHAERREDWLRGRRALHALLRRQAMSPDTARMEFPHAAISLTHSGEVAIAAGASGVAGVGVDYEHWRAVHPRMARWFLSEHEQAWLARVPLPRRGLEFLRLWTIKEALFKSCPQNAELVLADIRIATPERTTGAAVLPKRKSLRFRYTSLVLESGVLSLALSNRSNDHGQ